jgi:hypothetical protein
MQACVAGQLRQAEDGIVGGGTVIQHRGQEPPRLPRLLGRARKVDRSKPPMLWAVVDEAVLRRPVGGPVVFRSQLAHLTKVARSPGVVLQVMPFSAGAHAALGEFILLGLGDGRDVAYTESVESAILSERADEVEAFELVFDMIQAVALSPEASIDMVTRIQGEINDGCDAV